MRQTVIGIFDNASEAQSAVAQLVSKGFMRDTIDISTQTSAESSSNLKDKYDDDDDSIGGFFSSLFGGDNEDRNRYSSVARRGTVITVHTQSAQEAKLAADILDEYGAVDVNERAMQYGSTATATRTDANTSTSIPIIEENLQVGKRVVETGGVRLRSRIIEHPVEEHLRLREERVRVERQAVNRPVTEADLNSFKEGTIEVTEHAEVPVVAKEARVVEEVSLSKEVKEREEIIRDTVRKTDVEIENLDRDAKLDRDIDDEDFRNRPANL